MYGLHLKHSGPASRGSKFARRVLKELFDTIIAAPTVLGLILAAVKCQCFAVHL